MNIREIIVGDRVLVQSGTFEKCVAKVKDFSYNPDMVILEMPGGQIKGIDPLFIIKSFGS